MIEDWGGSSVKDCAENRARDNLKNTFDMEQLNKVELKGIVGRVSTQEIAEFKVVRFTLATNYAYHDKEGNGVVETQWHNVVWLDADKEISKADNIHVCGRIRYQKYVDIEGAERYSTEILANKVELI